MCAPEGSNCRSKTSGHRRRGITTQQWRRREGCGQACKVITKTDIYSDAGAVDLRFVDMDHDYTVGTHSFSAPADGPHEFTADKYGSEEDGTKFSGDNAEGASSDWRDAGCGCGGTDFCDVGVNYDNKRGFCGTSASGWPADGDASQCKQLIHKCDTINVYYWRDEGATGSWSGSAGALANRGSAVAPVLPSNVDYYTNDFAKAYHRRRSKKTGCAAALQKYTFALKKWIVCHATNVTDDGVPHARSCAVEKRCPCISCEKPNSATNDCVTSGDEPCDCQNLPGSVREAVATRCGAY